MFLPNELLSTVVFMGQDSGSGPTLRGTAFFVSVPAEGVNGLHIYLVTASHCVWDWAQNAPRPNLFIRINEDLTEGIKDAPIPDGDRWFLHPEPVPKVDIAALPINGTVGAALMQLGRRWVPRAMFFREEAFGEDADSGVGFSDEVVALGLFTNHSGRKRNEPIVRTGNIAMMPKETVTTNPTFGPMALYLVELRSITGMSGSPVFVAHRIPIGKPQRPASLFGVLLGHYPLQPVDMGGAAVNSGIGMVAPARLIGEVLDHEELVKRRQQLDRRARGMGEQAQVDMRKSGPTDEIAGGRSFPDLRNGD